MQTVIKTANIKKLAKEYGKRVGKDYLISLDKFVNELVIRSCKQFNGHKKTLDDVVLWHVTRRHDAP